MNHFRAFGTELLFLFAEVDQQKSDHEYVELIQVSIEVVCY